MQISYAPHTSSYYLHALKSTEVLTNSMLRKLLRYFTHPEAIWLAHKNELADAGMRDSVLQSFLHARKTTSLEKTWEILQSSNIKLIECNDKAYPSHLKDIPNAPVGLYMQGNEHALKKPLISIVGSRNCTPYGKRACKKIAEELVHHGFGIVSGLAYGIDSIAHETALEHHGTTIAVLGNGLHHSKISPPSKGRLAQTILQKNGLLLSEYAPFSHANKHTFPERNRIIAGLCIGTLVIEASLRSGSLITARFAQKYDRTLFAVPGSVFSEASEGPHMLIGKGAIITSQAKTIIETLRKHTSESDNHTENMTLFSDSSRTQTHSKIEQLTREEKAIMTMLSEQPLHIDKILKTITLETSQIQVILITLELKGLIKNIGSMEYIRLYT